MHIRCVLNVLKCCVLVGLDWAKPMMFLNFTCYMFMHFSCISTFIYLYFDLICVGVFLRVSCSLSFFRLVALWHLNKNPLRSRTLFVLGHLPLILSPPMSGSMMRRPSRTSRRTFHDTAFIRNAKLFYWIFPILTFPRSTTAGVESHCMASRSLVPL